MTGGTKQGGRSEVERAEVSWAAFADAAPALADAVATRFAANLHHVLGTVRPSGAPRLSGTEVRIDAGRFTLGMMAGSRKLADVHRDPRVEIHSAPIEEDLAAGDVKVAGRLLPLDTRDPTHPGAGFFELRLGLVSHLRVVGDELAFATWRPQTGRRETRRR